MSDIGHNNPPNSADEADARARAFAIEADAWAATIINDEIEASRLRDWLARVAAVAKEAEETREAEKRPHLEAGRAVDAVWKPVKDRLDAARKRAMAPLEAWVKAQEEQRRQKARAAEEAARIAREEAAALQARASASTNAAADAESAARAAQEAERTARAIEDARTRVGSFTGEARRSASLRTIRRARVTDPNRLFMALMREDGPRGKLMEVLERLANEALRATPPRTLPGVEVTVTEQLVA